MKKFILMFALLLGMAVNMTAQTIVKPATFDNTYVSVRYGVTALMHPGCNGFKNFAHSLAGQSELQFGKYITPKFGVALDGTLGWDTYSHEKMSKNVVPFVSVAALAKYRVVDFNRFGVVAVAGPGWIHAFDANSNSEHFDQNGIFTKFQLEFSYKVTDRVIVDVVPELNYNFTSGKFGHNHQPTFDARNAWYGLNVGLTYKFGNDFQLCDKLYTAAEWNALNEEVNNLRAELAKKPKEVKVVETKVVKETVKDATFLPSVTFERGSAVVGSIDDLIKVVKATTGTVTLVGSTSPEGPEELNADLATARANAVKKALVKAGVSADRIKTVTTYDAQRAVQVLLSK